MPQLSSMHVYLNWAKQRIDEMDATLASLQAKAWREAADTVGEVAAKFAVGRRADVDAALKKMKADAAEAETRLQQLGKTGQQSWAALSAGLAEARKAFDGANQAAWDAVKGAAPRSAA